MDKTDVIIKLIKDNGFSSIKSFAEKCGIPYTTMHSMLKRGIGNASVDNVILVCKNLGITVEELENMNCNSFNDEKPVPIIIAASSGGLTNEDERTKEILKDKQRLCETIFAANLDKRDIKTLMAMVKSLENL